MNPTTTSRATARLRLTVLAALPVLVLSAACGGAGDSAGGKEKSDEIASVPDTPSASRPGGGSSTDGGSDGSAPSTAPAGKSAFYDAQVKYVHCMRVKGGYKDYPDPKLSGHLDWTKIEEISSRPGQNEAAKGGKNGVCAPELQRAMLAEPKRDQQKDYESMLAHAKCMRDNGVSRFTNPTMSGGNAQPGGDPNPASPTIDTNSPAYKQAREACGTKLLDGLDGMQ
ncbi:hypothetical protein [Streptomyces gardneri]|uniref:Lipoprotein n=1 Tax=Streptomyces gardneri TaxID=66892 RepID=A0A4Y3RGT1_9ACTN|nr:hypothetical protein [Streptomyces gardneri]GEB55897.1 hypothetical protein SGA01_15020 [Streptomyces gardneri]GHH08789.1 hypothetical protein GCM10017674_51650 [Streptomyces gardneri]